MAFRKRFALEGRGHSLRVTEDDVTQFVDQRLDPGCFVHVGPDFDGLAGEGGAAVRPVQVGRGVDQVDGVAAGGDLGGDVVP
jgi:hypothetical protein